MADKKRLRFIMISAMYENGGNVTHRSLDGHPELYVYPFESQLGNSHSIDHLSSLFPFKYRWPDFPVTGDVAHDYDLFYDEEMKVRLRTPYVSKFREAPMELDESERRALFAKAMKGRPRSRANLVQAFFESTFAAWKNVHRSGKEKAYVGYSPVVGVDAEKMLSDFPEGHVIHVVRNPYSAYADTRKRPFPHGLERYAFTWSLVQLMALTSQRRNPKRFHILRFEDLVADRKGAMKKLLSALGLKYSDAVLQTTWNGQPLTKVTPWGTIRTPTPEANRATAAELSSAERREIRSIAGNMIEAMGYARF